MSRILANRPVKWVVLLALLLLAGALVGARLYGSAVPVYTVKRGDLVETVVASGKVRSPQRVELGSQITGKVARIPVAEGQTVRAGEVLIRLEDSELRAAVEQAKAGVAESELRLRQLAQLGLPLALQSQRQAEANYLQAQRQFSRFGELHNRGFISQAQLDEVQRNRDVAESQLRANQLQVQSNQPRGSDFRLAQTALQQARASLNLAQVKFDYATIGAPVSGTLIARSVEPGDVVQPGKVLMVLSPSGETQLVVQIDEKNMGLLALGKKALASADAYPGQRFEAEVVYINPAVDPLRGSVEVRLRAPQPPAYLRQDMTISVDIEAARRGNTLVVPSDAVHDAAGEKPWVWRVKSGKAHRQPVTLGLRGEGKLEVLQGLSAGDQLVPAGVAGIADGSRVRPVARE